MGDSTQACWDFAQAVADSLAMLGLELNADKTEVLDAVDARTEWFGRNPLGGYDDIAVDGSLTEEGALAVVLEHLPHDAPDPQRFPYALSALRASKNRDVVNTILQSAQALELFPKPVGDYLEEVGPVGDSLVERVLDGLAEPARDRSHARDLHLLRACRRERVGRIEGQALMRAAMNGDRPAPLRAWALEAAVRTGCVALGDVGDLVLDPEQPMLIRRAATAATRHFVRGAGHRLLAHPSVSRGRLVWTAMWASK